MRHTRRAWQRPDLSLLSIRAAQALALGAVVLLSDCGASENEPPAVSAPGPVQMATGSEMPAAADPPPMGAATPGEGMGDLPLLMPEPPVTTPPAMNPPPMDPPVMDPAVEPPVPEPPPCVPLPNTGSANDGDINVNLATELQTISGFGGMNMPRWIGDLTAPQRDIAFQTGAGQLGLTLLRISVSQNANDFTRELGTAQRAVALGVKVVATPWTPPANLKDNNNIVGGQLLPANYAAYADHLIRFVSFMQDNGVPIEAVSVQNEPDIDVDYDSAFWTPQQMIDFLRQQGPRFGETRIMAPESFNFNRQRTDPLLNDAQAAAQFDIVAGHVYGGGLADYPLARQRGKEVWMTEHITNTNDANEWPAALDIARDLNSSMRANFNAYIWWYIRRSYGLITENGQVSKRGSLMAQYARFVRPGFVRVGATDPQGGNVQVTAYKRGPGEVVVVALNGNAQAQNVNLDVFGSCVTSFGRFTTSQTKSTQEDAPVALQGGRGALTLDAQSLTTFVGRR